MNKRRPTEQRARNRGGQGVHFAHKLLELGELRRLSAECVRHMASTACDPDENAIVRVAAAKVVVGHHQWREDFERDVDPEELLRRLLGSDARFLAWLEDVTPKVRAKVNAGLLPAAKTEVPDGESED